tara:strand:- start:170 stop:394 length:225 start_codon:yes stop_codon:yes gene_type:complete
VNEQRGKNLTKPPEDIKGFYERMNTETPLSPEDEKGKDDDDAGGGKKGKKDKGKKEAKKKGKGKKGKDGEEGGP